MQRISTLLEPLTPAQGTLEFFDLPDLTQQPLTQRLDLEARAEALTVLTRLIVQVAKAAKRTEAIDE
jgi:hypothetical protein